VLVVDDEAGVRESIRMILRGQCDVETADGVDAGLQALGESNVDLILLDLVMPGRDGFDLLEALAKQKQAPPVLVLTATRDPSAAERALALGAVDCLRKPFEVEALRTRVRDLTTS
jgi:DNA-binding response OmpR family regulator